MDNNVTCGVGMLVINRHYHMYCVYVCPLLFNSGGLCDTMKQSHAVLCGQLNGAQPIMLLHTSCDDLLTIIIMDDDEQ